MEGREENRGLGPAAGYGWVNRAATRDGIYFLDSSSRTNAAVKFFDFATGEKRTIFTSDKPPSMGLAVSADGRSILYAQTQLAESSIMLVKNFRCTEELDWRQYEQS